jgi:hypothetical protein
MAPGAVLRPSSNDVWARFGLAAGGAFLFATGFRIYPAASSSTLVAVVSLLVYGTAFALWGIALATRQPFKPWTQVALGLGALIGIVVSVSYGILHEIPGYGTDVIALAHAGGEVLLDGVNPYSIQREDVLPILERMNLREGLFTQTASGDPVPGVTYYPGLHVLAYTAFVALGIPDLRWATLVFEVLALTVLWFAVSPKSRFLIPAVLLVEPYMTVIFTSGGVTDWVWVLPLVVSAIFLSRSGYAWAGFWLGLACAVKQQPWFAVPFVTIWVIHRVLSNRTLVSNDSGLKTVASFAAMLLLGFALPNLPFVLWAPADWLRGVLGPLLLDLMPDGQGVVVFVTSGLLSLSRLQFGVLLALIVVLLAGAYYMRFARLQHLLWLLPPIALFFSYRSLHSYFVFWLPVAAMWIDLEVRQKGWVDDGPIRLEDQEPV